MGNYNGDEPLFNMTPRQHFDDGVEFGQLETNLRHWTAAIPVLPETTREDLVERVKDAFDKYVKLAKFYGVRDEDVCKAVRPYLSAEEQVKYGIAPPESKEEKAATITAEPEIPEEEIPF